MIDEKKTQSDHTITHNQILHTKNEFDTQPTNTNTTKW